MTQTPGTAQTPGTETTARGARSRAGRRSMKRSLRAAGAITVTAGMVGVFAMPAYATSVETLKQPSAAYAQALTTAAAEIAVPSALPTAEEEPLPVVVAPAVESSAGSAGGSAGYAADVPAGVGAQGIVAAAYAQLGVGQDCTDLVQNSLAAVGLATRRDQGGYDHGPWSLASVGVPVTNGEWAPGDILGWPGYPHVAIYVGDGLAVHGGMGGSTVVASATGYFGTPTYVVRPA